jgi:hypothetical protein
LGAALGTLREGRQYGGQQERWLDDDEAKVGPFLVM